jgi:hypothetical protein
MPNPLESTLNASQRQSLEIVDFIFHIIELDDGRDEKIEFLDEVTLHEKQKGFFIARLQEILEGTQYVFLPDAVFLKEKSAQLATQASEFNTLSRQVAGEFARAHRNQMSEGIVVVTVVRFLASANNWKNLVLLVKLDKSASFSYARKVVDGKQVAVMNEIPNALAESKNAVQKSAVIDAEGHFAWDVLAYDRKTKPRLTGYFKAFLGVTERHPDGELTRMTHAAVRKWANALSKAELPENEDSASYIGRSMNYLKDRDHFDTESFIDTVVRDEDPKRKHSLAEKLRDALASAGIAGQQFTPQPGSLKPSERKQQYLTEEGVTITFEGSKEAVNLWTHTADDGQTVITIKTRNLTLK